jgi:hypothetical protein
LTISFETPWLHAARHVRTRLEPHELGKAVNWIQLGISLVTAFGLAAIAWLLWLGDARIPDANAARRMAEEMLAGFEARRALVAQNGNPALVAGDSVIVALKRHGARFAARQLPPPLSLSPAADGVSVETGERLFGRVTLAGITAADVRDLQALAGGSP